MKPSHRLDFYKIQPRGLFFDISSYRQKSTLRFKELNKKCAGLNFVRIKKSIIPHKLNCGVSCKFCYHNLKTRFKVFLVSA